MDTTRTPAWRPADVLPRTIDTFRKVLVSAVRADESDLERALVAGLHAIHGDQLGVTALTGKYRTADGTLPDVYVPDLGLVVAVKYMRAIPSGHNTPRTQLLGDLLADFRKLQAVQEVADRVVVLVADPTHLGYLERSAPLPLRALRISEALALKPADVDLDEGTIRVLRGKGRKARTVGIDDGALLYIERWLARRAALGLSPRRPLFSKLDGSLWSAQAVREALSYAAAKAGITKRVHPHGLRHSHAAELSSERVPVAAIQKQLGHASLAITSRYLDHLSPADVIAIGRARTWEVS